MKNFSGPLASVCMIAYNHEAFISQAIEGILMQSCDFPFELVIGENCSTDKTLEICISYATKYPEIIRLYPSERNIGMMPNFIRTINACTGKYIALCDSDDYWTDPLKLKTQVDFLENNENYGLVYSDVDKLVESRNQLEPRLLRQFNIKNTFEDFLMNTWFLAPCTWVFRKDIICDFLTRFRTDYVVYDLPILLEICNNHKIGFLDKSTAVYRILEKSGSHFCDTKEHLQFLKGIYNIQIDYAKKYNVSPDFISKIKTRFFSKIFTRACLSDYVELKKEAFNYMNETNNITRKQKYLYYLSYNQVIRGKLNKLLKK